MNSQKGIVGCLLLACTLQMPAQVYKLVPTTVNCKKTEKSITIYIGIAVGIIVVLILLVVLIKKNNKK